MSKVIVKIPLSKETYEEIKEMIKGTSYGDVEDYILWLIDKNFPSESEMSSEDEAIIRDRLRRLGYIE